MIFFYKELKSTPLFFFFFFLGGGGGGGGGKELYDSSGDKISTLTKT